MVMDELSRKRHERDLRRQFQPDQIRLSLNRAALFMVAYELLKSRVMTKTREFFIDSVDAKGFKYSQRYVSEVLERDKENRFRASCLWLAEQGAIEPKDIEVAERIRRHRHEIAHDLDVLIVDPDKSVDLALFAEAHRLVAGLDRFWGRIAVDGDERFDGDKIASGDIKSLGLLVMEYILSVVVENAT